MLEQRAERRSGGGVEEAGRCLPCLPCLPCRPGGLHACAPCVSGPAAWPQNHVYTSFLTHRRNAVPVHQSPSIAWLWFSPWGPTSPLGPAAPASPLSPLAPTGPVAPTGPGGPATHASRSRPALETLAGHTTALETTRAPKQHSQAAMARTCDTRVSLRTDGAVRTLGANSTGGAHSTHRADGSNVALVALVACKRTPPRQPHIQPSAASPLLSSSDHLHRKLHASVRRRSASVGPRHSKAGSRVPCGPFSPWMPCGPCAPTSPVAPLGPTPRTFHVRACHGRRLSTLCSDKI
eukprot:1985416-Rhodomonas_salina.2